MKKIEVRDDRGKLAFMRLNAHRAATKPLVVETASNLVRPFRPDDWRRRANALFHFVRDGVHYQRDPDRRENLADVRVDLTRGFGDCDNKAADLMALALSVGFEADLWPVWRGDELAHLQTALRWPGSERFANAHNGDEVLDGPDGGGWIVGDTTIAGAELGTDPSTVPRNPETGRLPLS